MDTETVLTSSLEIPLPLPEELPIMKVDLFSNLLPEEPKEETPPSEEAKAEPSFDLTSFLLHLRREVPDVEVIASPPFQGSEGVWKIDVHNTAKWLLVMLDDVRKVMSVEHLMDFNPMGDTWALLQNKEESFKSIDKAVVAIKSLLG